MKNNKKAVGVFITDTHLDRDNGELVKSIFDQIIDVCKSYGVSRIFHGGDVFTNRSGQPLQCLTDWKDILEKLKENEIQILVIPGNHDKTDADSDKSYLDVYSDISMRLFRRAGYIIVPDCLVCMVPYYSDSKWLGEFHELEERIDELLEEGDIDKNYSKILITHMGFDGVRNNDGSEVESIIKPSMFDDWDAVLIGHYHNASTLSENVIYPGSAYQCNYGENITDKGFTVVYSDGSTEFVPSKFPKYIREDVDATDKETLRNLLEKYDGEDYNHIRFVFHGKKTDCEKINIADIQGKYGIDCKFVSTEEKEAIEMSESDSVLEYTKQSLTKDFIKFCSDNEIKGKELKYGLDLIKGIGVCGNQ